MMLHSHSGAGQRTGEKPSNMNTFRASTLALPPSVMTVEAVLALMAVGSSDWSDGGCASILDLRAGFARVARDVIPTDLRPGGAISGPTLFWMCDAAFYAAILATRGPAAASAVTTSMTMNFLRPAAPGRIIADCTLVRNGKRLATGDMRVFADGADATPIVQCVGIFSAPAA